MTGNGSQGLKTERRMRNTAYGMTAVAVLVLVAGFAGHAHAQTADGTAAVIEKHYAALTDLTAKVSQKNRLKTIGKTQTFEGTLSVKRPGRLRLDYTNGQTIVLDGATVWFYSKKSKQAMRRTYKAAAEANVPVAFLLGAAELRNDFTVALPGDLSPGALELAPRKAGAAMKKLRLQADAEGRITALTITDTSGNVTEIAFSDIREGAGVEDGIFTFKVPKGTEVIEQ